MKSLNSILKKLASELATIDCGVYHYERPVGVKAPFLIWNEESGESYSHADNRTNERTVSCLVDFYTQTEFDPLVEQIEGLFEISENISWDLESIDYEYETKTIHVVWNLAVV